MSASEIRFSPAARYSFTIERTRSSGTGPSKPQPNADWTETWTARPASAAFFAVATIRRVASAVSIPVFFRLCVSLAETPRQTSGTPQASARSRPFSFRTRPERTPASRRPRGEATEQLVRVRHLRDLLRVDEGADLHDVDAGGEETLDPRELRLRRDRPRLDLEAVAGPDFVEDERGVSPSISRHDSAGAPPGLSSEAGASTARTARQARAGGSG